MFDLDDAFRASYQSIPVETHAGTILFRVPENALILFRESYWEFIKFLQARDINILHAICTDSAIIVTVDENKKELINEYMESCGRDERRRVLSRDKFANVVMNDPYCASKFVEYVDINPTNLNKNLWTSVDFVAGMFNISYKWVDWWRNANFRNMMNTVVNCILKNTDPKMFRSKKVLNEIKYIFYRLNVNQIMQLGVPAKVFRKWLINGFSRFDYPFYELWSYMKIPGSNYLRRYINIRNILTYAATNKTNFRTYIHRLPDNIRYHPDVNRSYLSG